MHWIVPLRVNSRLQAASFGGLIKSSLVLENKPLLQH